MTLHRLLSYVWCARPSAFALVTILGSIVWSGSE